MIWIALAVIALPVLIWLLDGIFTGKNGVSRF